MLLVPAFLSVAGNDGYALWLVLFNCANLIAAFSTGFLHYCSNLVNISYHTSANIKVLVQNIIKTAAWVAIFQLFVGVVVSVPGLLSFFLSFNERYLDANNASACILLLLVARLLYQYISLFLLRLFEPLGGIRKTLKYQFVVDFVDFATTGIAILLSGSILVTCLSVCVVNILMFVAAVVYVKRQVPFYSPALQGKTFVGGSILKNSGMLSVGFLIEKFYDNGINLVVQAYFGAMGTTLFSTCRSMANVFYRLTYSVMLPLFPSIQKQFALKDFTAIGATARRYWSISSVVIMAGIICGLPLIPVFYKYWTKGEVLFDINLIVFLFIAVLFQNFIFVISEFLKKTNFSVQLVVFNIVKVIVSVACIWLFSFYGYTWGIGAGIAIAEVCSTIYAVTMFSKKVFAIKRLFAYFIQVLVFALLLLLYVVSGNYVLFAILGAILLLMVLIINVKRGNDLD